VTIANIGNAMRFMSMAILLHAVLACNPGKLMEGRNSSTETAATEAADAESPVDTSVLDTGETYSESTIADEPISVGGAFLTCRYQDAQNQGSASYQMNCEVAPAADVTGTISKAEFFKLDNKGARSALAISSEDLSTLKWTILETAATLPFTQVELVLSAKNAASVSLTTTLESPLILTQVTTFWLGGEPNNITVGNPEGEDCVEFGNLAAKIDHQNRTDLVSGTSGRMNDINCNIRVSSFLCRSLTRDSSSKWVLSALQGNFDAFVNACPEGYSFGFPIDEREVAEVAALIDGNPAVQNIWVNMNDRTEEGKFSVRYR
jgi:hypothetical protein